MWVCTHNKTVRIASSASPPPIHPSVTMPRSRSSSPIPKSGLSKTERASVDRAERTAVVRAAKRGLKAAAEAREDIMEHKAKAAIKDLDAVEAEEEAVVSKAATKKVKKAAEAAERAAEMAEDAIKSKSPQSPKKVAGTKRKAKEAMLDAVHETARVHAGESEKRKTARSKARAASRSPPRSRSASPEKKKKRAASRSPSASPEKKKKTRAASRSPSASPEKKKRASSASPAKKHAKKRTAKKAKSPSAAKRAVPMHFTLWHQAKAAHFAGKAHGKVAKGSDDYNAIHALFTELKHKHVLAGGDALTAGDGAALSGGEAE